MQQKMRAATCADIKSVFVVGWCGLVCAAVVFITLITSIVIAAVADFIRSEFVTTNGVIMTFESHV